MPSTLGWQAIETLTALQLTIAFATLAVAAASSWLIMARSLRVSDSGASSSLHDSSSSKRRLLLLPPMANGGFWHVVSKFFSKNLHTYLLELSRNEGTIVSLPFGFMVGATGGLRFLVVADYRAARNILLDPTSTKWHVAYAVFDEAFGGPNFFRPRVNGTNIRVGIIPRPWGRSIRST